MQWKRAAAALLVCAVPAASAFGAAAGLESHDRIRTLAESYARARAEAEAPSGATVSAEAATLDPRLALPACAVTPETFDPPGRSAGGQTLVGVRCPSGAAWSIYVPVRLDIVADVVVLAAPTARGQPLDSASVRLEPRDVAGLAAYMTATADAEGMLLRRGVPPGTVLTASMLERPRIVKRGERVRVRAGGGLFQVVSEAEALADAAEGDHVRVRNTRSGLIVEGVVDAEGNVVADW
ncbi:MAG TPA: flagellar basal body P-ring formation chaperone FlgA [Gammaproteobacteria bacterium]|nr:flagellar basal body P-ring formation chaperone FlgA [Gammaproteobacteria bacterium]